MINKYVIIIMLSLLVSSCANTGLKIINGLAKSGDYRLYKNISYGKNDENIVDVYVPSKQKTKAVIVFFYGGCWGNCTSKTKKDYLFVADTLTKQGYAVVIPDYAQYPDVKFNKIMLDADKAVTWTINNLTQYQIESPNIYLMGHSSGAHIAAMLADNKNYLKSSRAAINGFIGLAGPYDFYPFTDDYLYDLFDATNDYYDSQPIHFVDGNEPAHLILHGKKDKTVFIHNAQNIAARLKKVNSDYELQILKKMNHVSILVSLSKPLRRNSKVLKHINSFIEKYNND